MKTAHPYTPIVSLMMLFALFSTGCAAFGARNPEAPQTRSKVVEAGSATSAKVKIMMDLGQLTIDGGSEKLMEGIFNYNFTDLQPRIQYTEDGKAGSLLIDQPTKMATTSYRNAQIQWDVRLNDHIPVDLDVSTGAAATQLNLANIDLTGLKLEFGVGSSVIDLSGAWPHDVAVDIKGGIGKVTITLPRAMGVRVMVKSGIGKVNAPGFSRSGEAYVNAVYGQTAQSLNLTVEPGVGEVILKEK